MTRPHRHSGWHLRSDPSGPSCGGGHGVPGSESRPRAVRALVDPAAPADSSTCVGIPSLCDGRAGGGGTSRVRSVGHRAGDGRPLIHVAHARASGVARVHGLDVVLHHRRRCVRRNRDLVRLPTPARARPLRCRLAARPRTRASQDEVPALASYMRVHPRSRSPRSTRGDCRRFFLCPRDARPVVHRVRQMLEQGDSVTDVLPAP